ncbi:MAG: WecB/TagA/CpsF family glycosyltransferase [Patescibacteria group bacterium]|jgi:N-acetylglucosaminyldiphosphoundecaprenol N-acetyl-beta-D-mannosaminyltransferase
MTPRQRISVLGVPVDCVTSEEAILAVRRFVASRLPSQITTVNPEFLVAAQTNTRFRHVLKEAELSVADGTGVRAAATFLSWPAPSWQPMRFVVTFAQGLAVGALTLFRQPAAYAPVPATVTGTDLLLATAAEAAANGWRLYLVGGDPGIAEAAANALTDHFPGLHIAGAEEGVPKPEHRQGPLGEYESALVDRIRAAEPDILAVAFGAPRQELFIHAHKAVLGVPVMIGVGGAFDFYVGTARRAPNALRAIGLEWLWRVVTQPWRWSRILTATVQFPFLVFLSKQRTR